MLVFIIGTILVIAAFIFGIVVGNRITLERMYDELGKKMEQSRELKDGGFWGLHEARKTIGQIIER